MMVIRMNNINANTSFHPNILGAFCASFYIGNCVGPLMAGIWVNFYGWRLASAIFFSLFCVMVLVALSSVIYHTVQASNRNVDNNLVNMADEPGEKCELIRK